MNDPQSPTAESRLQSTDGRPEPGSTVYLRCSAPICMVSINDAPLLSTTDTERAFQAACEARTIEGGRPLRLLILSGPSAEAYISAAIDANEVASGLAQVSAGSELRPLRDERAPPEQRSDRRAGATA